MSSKKSAEVISQPNVHKIPRFWSNDELKKFAFMFEGRVVNVSAWEDKDKQGSEYSRYFSNSAEYWVTNYKSDMRGLSGLNNELYLDLEAELPDDLSERFDAVFNHTTLEHVFNLHQAVDNLVKMSKDILILVVPVMQQVHVAPTSGSVYNSEYGDFWRFTPQAIERLLRERGMTVCYMSFNTHRLASVYAFCIATKNPEKWVDSFPMAYSHVDYSAVGYVKQPWAGCNAFRRHPLLIERLVLVCARSGSFLRRTSEYFFGLGRVKQLARIIRQVANRGLT